ncbi:WD40-repeat-containing domain protein [Fimicolochytrium jonesii]|uniref:WD40-repeat-containing domain protein n=1 Tax=Fimicolochytrium jonesii TaxID=1396493 RepID=UPI0022FEB0D5|nr:WD40-repeat-containing domain protein [Fimicolochytrium jonesii]KAI8823465.1 WD40-repeat-containing domain protein [Fimicolochytrium jonesii]
MNIGRKSNNELLFINFNQDFSCVSVGTRHGYRIYNCDPIGKCYGQTQGGIGIVEMLFCTSLVALVGAGEQPAFSPRRLHITNTKRQSTICELTFVTAILAVKLNRKRLVVILEEHIYIYDISNMRLLRTIDTSPNPNALCALSPSSDNCYLAYPPNASGAAGELLLFDAINLQAIHILQAHKSPLSCIAFNYDGTMVATASDKGTIIRVFSVPTGDKVFQFRRGTYPARIYSISFNLEATLLCVSSATDTVHVFKLITEQEQAAAAEAKQRRSSGSGSGSRKNSVINSFTVTDKSSDCRKSPLVSAAGSVGSYFLPDMLTEMWEPSRDFCFAKLPSGSKGSPNICAISSLTPATLAVVTAEGWFYQYAVDLENGGECNLVKEFPILENEAGQAGPANTEGSA